MNPAADNRQRDFFIPKISLRSPTKIAGSAKFVFAAYLRPYAFALAAIFLAFLALPNCLGFLRVLPEVPLLILPRFER